MPVKYTDRIKLPAEGMENIEFSTPNGLLIAKGYERVIMTKKGPLIEFAEAQICKENVCIPQQQTWRITNDGSTYIEWRSRDYCNVKISQQKADGLGLTPGKFYVSPFDLRSDSIPVLISPLRRKHTLQGTA